MDRKFDDVTQAVIAQLELDDESDLEDDESNLEADSLVDRQLEDNHVVMNEDLKVENHHNTLNESTAQHFSFDQAVNCY